MGFRESWINFLHRAATGTKKTRTLLTPIGVMIFGVFTALFVFAAIIVDRLLHLPRLLPEGARLPLSIPVMAVGAAVTAWSAFHFLKVKGTPVPFNPPPKVVKSGPYRYSRNPMVAGVFVFLFGLGFAVKALEDLNYDKLHVGVDYAADGALALAVRLEGRNPAIEGGRPLHYNLNINENLPDLLNSLRLADEVSGRVEQRITQ